MPLPESLANQLRLPVIAAPMFLASGPQLVIEACKAGIVGTFPALNQRTNEGLDQWLIEIKAELAKSEAETGDKPAPFGVNLIVHPSNPRLKEDLATCVKHEVPLIITSLGASKEIVDAAHGYGGVVFHDIVIPRHGRKAAEAGVDGLVLVSGGAGGHAGTLNPFALVNEVRQFFDKTVLLSGCLSNGNDIAAAQMMGADLAYMGSRFLGTKESQAQLEYKEMMEESVAADIIYTPKISGVPASFMRQSIENHGVDIRTKETPKLEVEVAGEENESMGEEPRPWVDLWSAGQGVGSIKDTPSVAELVDRLEKEYRAAHDAHSEQLAVLK